MTIIYALQDEIGKIRYIGKTCNTIHKRFAKHLGEARRGVKGRKSNWIRSLFKRGFIPSIIQIGEVKGDGCRDEIAWIKYFRDEGVDLVNTTDGGEGAIGLKHSDKSNQKNRLAHLGKKQSAETIKKRISVCTGKKRSVEQLRGMGLAQIGHIVSRKTRLKLSIKNQGNTYRHDSWQRKNKTRTDI